MYKDLFLIFTTVKTKQETKGEEIPSANIVASIIVGLWTTYQAN